MVTGQEFLYYQLVSVQQMQYVLTLADEADASHALKTSIREQLATLDQLESHLQILSVQRGWDIPDYDPIRKSLTALRFRQRKDSGIAEYLIRLYTDHTVAMMKHFNQWKADDSSIRNLFQKVSDCCAIGIRQMQPFL